MQTRRIKSLLYLLLCSVALAACRLQVDAPVDAAPVPDTMLTGDTISPGTGFPRDTGFRFAATLTEPVNNDYAVVLMIYSPDTINQWSWLTIDMNPLSNTRFEVIKKMEDFSTLYRFKYAIQHLKTGKVVMETAEFAGPQLQVNSTDYRVPEVLWSTPADGSTGVSPTPVITFVFDDVIDPQSVNNGNIMVQDNTVDTIAAFQNRVVVTFAQPFGQSSQLLEKAASYQLTLQNVRDLNGNAMQPYTLSFSVSSPLIQAFAVESRKYSGYCLTVKDIKKRFADPQAWNPVVELEPCLATDSDLSQRWFMEKTPGMSGSGKIVWASNYDYCLSKKSAGNPVIARCNAVAEQHFSLDARDDHYLIASDDGGCIAAGVVDVGEPNKIESSLCTRILDRNHWYIQTREKTVLAPAFMMGNVNIRFVDILYNNTLTGVNLSTEQTRELVMYLYQTEALNQADIYRELNLVDGTNKGEGFSSANPFYPRNTDTTIALPKPRSIQKDGMEIINPEGYADILEGYRLTDQGTQYFQQTAPTRWFSDVTHGHAAAQEVCAILFEDSEQKRYNLRTFPSREEALAAGWIVTHQYHCGSCSTLKDLAVYMGIPDQTSPVRLCTKRGKANIDNLDQVKQCIMESVGFTPMCAETWAYNGIHTGTECNSDCLKTYGNDALIWPQLRAVFTMVIAEKFNACPPEVESSDPVFREQMKASGCPLANEETGRLNDCLWCDEKTSGPGFKFAAGRTRRASGLKSEIPRPNDRLYYEADHTQYFR